MLSENEIKILLSGYFCIFADKNVQSIFTS